MIRFAFVFTAALLTACSLGGNLTKELEDKGPIALSDDNPFLAGNLLLSQWAERLPALQGFLKHRGNPKAVQVEGSYFSEPKLKLFYLDKREFYKVEAIEETAFIQGPFQISPEEYGQIERIAPPAIKAAANLDAQTGDSMSAEPPVDSRPCEPQRDMPRPTDTPSPPDPKVQIVKALQAGMQGASAVEITPKGDAVHYVTFDGETLSMIARWYTHDQSNIGRLIRMNKLRNPNRLEVGDTIIIPSYLLKSKLQLTEDAVAKLKAARGAQADTRSHTVD